MWETTMNAQKSIRLQNAADLVGDLADAVEAMGKQLDRLHGEIGEDLFGRVAQAFPVDHGAFGPKANSALVKLMHELTPPDDYDRADARMP
jgi:hypothetical protein